MKFTSGQIDTLMKFVDENFSANAAPLPIDFDALQKNFNAEMKTFLSQCPFDDAGDDRFKILVCAYTVPETNEENVLSSMILVGFVKVLLPDVDAEKFLREMSASGKKFSGGVNFSISSEDNITFVTAEAHEEVSA